MRQEKRGFTIVEIIVALCVTTAGVLGLAATAALVERLAGEGAAQTRAASLAQSRFELLRSSNCASVGSGSSTSSGLIESWSGWAVAGHIWMVTDSVVFLTGRRTAQVYRSLVEC